MTHVVIEAEEERSTDHDKGENYYFPRTVSNQCV
jgi:hypothetical protein